EGETDMSQIEDYHSHNTEQLTDQGLKDTLLSLDYIKNLL
ncbi:UDP-glucose 4-epimerase, partial [Maribacter sp. 2307ULW6-5]